MIPFKDNSLLKFTKGELSGIIVLICLLILAFTLPYLYNFYSPKSQLQHDSTFFKEVETFYTLQENKQHPRVASNTLTQKKDSIILFNFDPNKIDFPMGKKLGLSTKQILSIQKYLAKGGKFRQKEDLSKMYVLSPKEYQKILPYITIPETTPKHSLYQKIDRKPIKIELIEINSADTLQLTQIRGVGQVFANRITKYRDRIGGFYKKEQLKEVFGLDSIKYTLIEPQISINPDKIIKTNINIASFDDLKRYPYWNYKQISALLNYKKQHGNFKSIQDLYPILLLNKKTIENITPYLIFE